MSSSSLADYLASKYLTADAPAKKPKKRKRHAASEGLVIADDDVLGWEDSEGRDSKNDDDAPVTGFSPPQTSCIFSADNSIVVTNAFRSTKANWKTVGENEAEAAAAADAILAANAADAPKTSADDDPVDKDGNVVRMTSGAHAGLQTGEQVAAQMAAARRAEQARFAAADPAESGRGAETIFRDASGRIVNVAMARAEARAKIKAEEDEKLRQVEQQKGDVQKIEAEARRERLRDAKYMTLSRYADDRELNDELKEKDLWEDPAAAFLTKKKPTASDTGKPLYKGPWEPNRYGIRPGHRWDGVDRGIGFEKRWFQAQNKRGHRKEMEYAWQMDAD